MAEYRTDSLYEFVYTLTNHFLEVFIFQKLNHLVVASFTGYIMPVIYESTSFAQNRLNLIRVGLWPLKSNVKFYSRLHLIYRMMMLILIVYFVVAMWALVPSSLDRDIFDFTSNMGMAITHTMSIMKEYFFWYYHEEFEKLLQILESKQFIYEEHPQLNFFPNMITKQYSQNSSRFPNYFFYAGHNTLFCMFFPRMVMAILHHVNPKKFNLPDQLPHYMWTPFDISTSRGYLLGLLYQSYLPYYDLYG